MTGKASAGPDDPRQDALRRELGVFDATMMGLGSIVGTGVFVSIGVAAGIAGPAVIVALGLAALLALCNAFSSADLATNHPISGGTYEYGYRYLAPWLGFTAGWMFLCAKTASGATAALGFAGYLLRITSSAGGNRMTVLALVSVIGLTLVVLGGMRHSSRMNVAIVTVTLTSLVWFVLAGLPTVFRVGEQHLRPFFGRGSAGTSVTLAHVLQATALMFVAYTGYARLATLGEEVREPERTIPRAIIVTLALAGTLYVGVALVAVGAVGADALGRVAATQAAPLEFVATALDRPIVRWVVAIGAMTAMLGVLLNLILGLSRMLLAMGRRRDMPASTARLNVARTTPYVAVIVVGCLIGGLALTGSVETTWSFSAFTVLIYYAITNLAALCLKPQERRFHQGFSWCGLAGCLFLAFWVETRIGLAGMGLIGIGLLWHGVARWRSAAATRS